MKDGLIQRGSTWSYMVRVPDPVTGRTKPRWVGGFTSRDEAKAARDAARVAARRGVYVNRIHLTLGEYLELWLVGHAVALKPKTISGYRHVVDRYVAPRVGGLRLQAVKPTTLTRLYADLLVGGGRAGGALSPRTVHGVHRVLHRALQDAVNEDLLGSNPAARARPPKVIPVDVAVPWAREELAAFLEVAKGHRLGCYYHLAAYTGGRRGELLALTWADISLDDGLVSISKSTAVIDRQRVTGSPKGGRSRVIGIDAGTVTTLRQHLARRASERGSAPGPSDLVFCQPDGTPLSPDTVTQLMPALCRAAGVRRIRLHDLRHLHATWLLTAGQPIHEVARRLGHRDAVVTLSTYAHVVGGRDAMLAESFAAMAEPVDSKGDSSRGHGLVAI